jgi:hypothetical protein
MDLSRPKREMMVAQEFAVELLNVSMPRGAEPKSLAHHFAVTCERLGVLLDEAAVGRVLGYTSDLIKCKGRQVEGVRKRLDHVAEVFGSGR